MTKGNWRKKTIAIAVAAAIVMTSGVPVLAKAAPDGKTDAAAFASAIGKSSEWEAWKTEWETKKSDWTQMSLTPGSDETQLNFAWYTAKADGFVPTLQIATKADMSDAVNLKVAQTEVADETDSNGTTYMSNKATATGLAAGTTYYYRYETARDKFSDPIPYTPKKSDSFSFIFTGDPQIGSSNELKGSDSEEFYDAQASSVCNDAFVWSQTLNAALAKTDNNASFVISAGDQIQTTKKKAPNNNAAVSEVEYSGYLSPDALKSLPVATTVGNHDADNANYTYHFNTPNMSKLGDNGTAGGDYWFTYGDVLFLDLNLQGEDNNDEHIQFVEETTAAHSSTKWQIVVLHQDIYGSAEHSNEPEITNLRYSLVPTFEECGVDVVLSGHDHAYSRTWMMKGAEKNNSYTDDEFDKMLEEDIDNGDSNDALTTAPGNIKSNTTDEAERTYLDYLNSVMDKDAVQNISSEAVTNPDGILFLTGDSASGSKYYDLVARKQSYIASRWQQDIPTYSVIDVDSDSLTVNTYRTDTGEAIDTTFTIYHNGDNSALRFTDVDSDAYYYNSVKYADAKKITKGTTATTFSPGSSCTRAQAVTFLWRSAGSPKAKNNKSAFTDVKSGTYYYDAVCWAVENGITAGTTETTFSPNATVTRGQIVTFLCRKDKGSADGIKNSFKDVRDGAYYAEAVIWADANDITAGTTATTFSPDEECTRAQIVTFLHRESLL